MTRTQAGKLADRLIVEINGRIGTDTVPDIKTIRRLARAHFAKVLDGRLRNLQEDETIQITYRVDILTADGQVRGGKNSERNMPEYAVWRSAVFERDGFACLSCGSRQDIQAHHAKSWRSHPELRFDVANGRTLCVVCHAKEHPNIRGFLNASA